MYSIIKIYLIFKIYYFQEECAELLEMISDRINTRNPEFISHLLLSIFKMAEVEIVAVEPSSASEIFKVKLYIVLLSLFTTSILQKLLLIPS